MEHAACGVEDDKFVHECIRQMSNEENAILGKEVMHV